VGAAAGDVTRSEQFVVVVAAPIAEVVEDLKRDAQLPRVFLDRFDVLRDGTREPQTREQRRFERRRRLERVDFERLVRGQRLVASVAPEEFCALTLAQT
jgi:hypothetical protein